MPDTDPIQPDASAPAPAAPPPPDTVNAADVITEASTDAVGTDVAQASNIDTVVGGGKSPLKGQFIGERGQPRPMPIKLIFQDGIHQGRPMDLGTAILEASMSQDAQWSSSDNKTIRAGASYDGIGARSFSFSTEYADTQENILYLSEMAAHTQERDPKLQRPPKLILVMGDRTIPDWVANRFNVKMDEPYAGDRGFRHATVDLDLSLYGGVDSPYASGKPLFPTPLSDEAQEETEIERGRRGAEEVARIVLADCLSDQANDELAPLAAQGQVTDPQKVLELSDEAIVQGAIAGMFTQEALNDEAVKRRLEGALASVMAANEPGLSGSSQARTFANVLLTGDMRGLQPVYRPQAERRIPQFNEMLDAIQTQSLDEKAQIWSTEAGDLLRTRIGPCGLILRGTGTIHQISATEAENLQKMRDFLGGDSVKDDEIRRRFGLTEEDDATLETIKNGQPYQSKDDFIRHLSQQGDGTYSAEILWQNFAVSEELEDNPDGGDPLDAG